MRFSRAVRLVLQCAALLLAVPPVRLGAAPAATAAVPRAEHFFYLATWNGLPVANAELLVQPGAGGRPDGVVLRGRAETNQMLDLLWRMRDSVDATVLTDPIAPRSFVLRQNENGRRRETTVTAKPPRLLGQVQRRHRKTRQGEVDLHPDLHDPASIAYLIRTTAGTLDGPRTYEVLTGTKIYTLHVQPAATETLTVAGRTWQARRLHLSLDLGYRDVQIAPEQAADDAARVPERDRERWRALKIQDADLWISTGPERLPLRMRGRTFWGWVTVELSGRDGPPTA